MMHDARCMTANVSHTPGFDNQTAALVPSSNVCIAYTRGFQANCVEELAVAVTHDCHAVATRPPPACLRATPTPWLHCLHPPPATAVYDLTSIEEDERFAAPMCKAFQGWKQVKRKQKGDQHQKQTTGQVCGWCGKTGHNIRGLDDPVQQRKRQRG